MNDGIRRRPVEKLLPPVEPGPVARTRRALALTTRELVLIGVGVAGTVSSWATLIVWCH